MKKILLIAIVLLAWGLGASHALAYSFERSITISHTQVPNTDQTNFPMEYAETDSWLKTVANGGKIQNTVAQTGGSGLTVPADFILASDAACTTKLNFEFESYNSTTGNAVLWVQVPSASHSADTSFYQCYGDSSVTTWQGNVTGTWDSNYIAVYHLPDGSTLSPVDSTGNNNGTNNGATATSGQVDGAAAFNGSSQYIDLGTSSTLGVGANGAITLETWANFTNLSGIAGMVSNATGPNAVNWELRQLNSTTFDIFSFNGSAYAGRQMTVSPGTNTWHHYAGTSSGSNTWAIYYDGVAQSPSFDNAGGTLGGSNQGYIGQEPGGTRFMPGSLDEVRISKVARSADWIATEYNNQSATSTFYTVGAEVPLTSSTNNQGAQLVINLGRLVLLQGRLVIGN